MSRIDARVTDVERLPLARWPDAIKTMGFDADSTQYLRDRYKLRRMSRSTDPSTSHQAAERVVSSGQRDDHISRIVSAVSAYPDRTSAELAQVAGLERHEAARRTADAEHAGLIRKGPARKCSLSGRAAVVWQLERAA